MNLLKKARLFDGAGRSLTKSKYFSIALKFQLGLVTCKSDTQKVVSILILSPDVELLEQWRVPTEDLLIIHMPCVSKPLIVGPAFLWAQTFLCSMLGS